MRLLLIESAFPRPKECASFCATRFELAFKWCGKWLDWIHFCWPPWKL